MWRDQALEVVVGQAPVDAVIERRGRGIKISPDQGALYAAEEDALMEGSLHCLGRGHTGRHGDHGPWDRAACEPYGEAISSPACCEPVHPLAASETYAEPQAQGSVPSDVAGVMTNNSFKRLPLALALVALTVTVGFLLYVTFQPEQLIINFVTWFIALIWFVRIAFLGSPMQPVPDQVTGAARWRVSFILVAFTWSIPTISVIQATSADSRDAIIVALTKGGRAGIPEVLCLLAVTILIILIPGYLNARGPKWTEKSYAPGWLAGFAAFFTGAYVVLLHFARGALAGLHIGTVYFAAFGVALLLVPLYRAIASACWRYGSFKVLDPCCWWQSFYATFREMRGKGIIAPAAGKISRTETRDSKTLPGSD